MKMPFNEMKMGYILAYKNDGSFIGNQIAYRQRLLGFKQLAASMTHVEISGGGEYSIDIAPPKSKCVRIDKRHKGRYVYILRYKNSHCQDKGRYKVAYFSATLCNVGYDIAGILGFLYKWIKHNNRLWFCSEGALWAFRKVYPSIMPLVNPDKCMPAHFLESKEFEIVDEGIIE